MINEDPVDGANTNDDILTGDLLTDEDPGMEVLASGHGSTGTYDPLDADADGKAGPGVIIAAILDDEDVPLTDVDPQYNSPTNLEFEIRCICNKCGSKRK